MVIPERRKVGQYEILRKLGRGGMADVYLAQDTEHQRTVALKVIEQGPDADSRETIEAERRGSELQARLAEIDPRVVKIFDAGDMDGYFVVAMEYVEGQDLSDLMRDGPAPVDDAVDIALAICQTLHNAHTLEVTIDGKECRGIVHGDIKPKNIRIDHENRVRVLDFGIAKALVAVAQAHAQRVRQRALRFTGAAGFGRRELHVGPLVAGRAVVRTGDRIAALSGRIDRAPGAHDPLAHSRPARAGPLPGRAAPHPDEEHGSGAGAAVSVRRGSGRGPGGVSSRRAGPRERRRNEEDANATRRTFHPATAVDDSTRRTTKPVPVRRLPVRQEPGRQARQPLWLPGAARLGDAGRTGARLHRICRDVRRGPVAARTATRPGYPRRSADRSGRHLEPLGGYLQGQSRRRWRYLRRAAR